jgi:ketosteroid isomerase-like protein
MKEVEVVQEFYRALAAGDIQTVVGFMGSDIEWLAMWNYKAQGRGPTHVVDDVLKPFLGDWRDVSMVPDQFICEGDTVVSLGHFGIVNVKTEKYAEGRYSHVWTVESRKIVRFCQYIDTLAITEAEI